MRGEARPKTPGARVAGPVVREEASPSPSRSRFWRWAALLLLLCLGFQVFVLATRRVPRNSDQAIVGLMARHILAGKGHPVFYYGVAYAGSAEPHYVAAVFAIAGASPATYRVAMTILLLALAIGVSLLSRRLFG